LSAVPSGAGRTATYTLDVGRLQRFWLAIWVASGCIAFIEPSPYEICFVFAFLVLVSTGLSLTRELIPFIFIVLLYNLGGAFALIPWLGESKSVTFIIISFYLAITAIVFAAATLTDTERRMRAIERGAVIGAVVASLAGIAGFFNVAGLGSMFALWGESRASGTFKDPNVLGPFLVLPIMVLMQSLLLGRRNTVMSAVLLGILALSLFFTFSRGAWGAALLGTALLFGITFLVTADTRLRARIVVVSVLGSAFVSLLLVVALTDPRIREIFEMRASLNQTYDLGATGRFGNQLRSLPMLFDNPQGIGPLRFPTFFRDAPHNVFLNAFHSYGWLGGIAYLGLTVSTVGVGFWAVFQRTPWQAHTIAVWAALFPQIVQGFQIDTDHWRHLWMLFGLIWGLAAANTRWIGSRRVAAGLHPGRVA
jgi:hypothetical protein